jgi:adenylate kinase family enzyme
MEANCIAIFCETIHFRLSNIMKKITIVGSSGSGKSTLARELSSRLDIKIYHLDRIFWRSGWGKKPREKRIDILQNLVRERRWIIDGTYLSTSELHLDEADTIVFLDIDPLLCLKRTMKRHYEYYELSRRDIPMGSTDKLTLLHVLKVLFFTFQGYRTIKQKLRSCKANKIIWLRSREEVEDFVAQLNPHSDKESQVSKTLSVVNQRDLALAEDNRIF